MGIPNFWVRESTWWFPLNSHHTFTWCPWLGPIWVRIIEFGKTIANMRGKKNKKKKQLYRADRTIWCDMCEQSLHLGGIFLISNQNTLWIMTGLNMIWMIVMFTAGMKWSWSKINCEIKMWRRWVLSTENFTVYFQASHNSKQSTLLRRLPQNATLHKSIFRYINLWWRQGSWTSNMN